MHIPAHWPALAVLGFLTLASACGEKPAQADLDHIREELGVNSFTAPSIQLEQTFIK